MTIVLVQFGLMVLNLFSAKNQKENGRNPAFSYFVSAMCFSFGLTKLIELFLK
jgi:hypothetical protein